MSTGGWLLVSLSIIRDTLDTLHPGDVCLQWVKLTGVYLSISKNAAHGLIDLDPLKEAELVSLIERKANILEIVQKPLLGLRTDMHSSNDVSVLRQIDRPALGLRHARHGIDGLCRVR